MLNIRMHAQLLYEQNSLYQSIHIHLHNILHKEENLSLEKSYTDG